jgi:hypothetical protein
MNSVNFRGGEMVCLPKGIGEGTSPALAKRYELIGKDHR